MKPKVLEHLRAPGSNSFLEIEQAQAEENGEIKEGELLASESGEQFPIRNFIPRFVPDDSYTASFGEQWNRYRRTQLDRFNGTTLSHDRFYSGTGWTPEDLKGKRILEVGCGAGRFTQIMLDAGAKLFSVDYSSAVEACWTNNGPHPNLFLAQAGRPLCAAIRTRLFRQSFLLRRGSTHAGCKTRRHEFTSVR